MIKKALIILTCLFFTSQAYALDLTAKDKQGHMITSGLIALVPGVFAINHDDMTLKSGLWALLAANVPGVLKEIFDSREEGNKFDVEDLAANLIGSSATLLGLKIGYKLYLQATNNSLNIGMIF